MVDLSNFCNKCDIYDKVVNMSAIDTLFINSNYEIEKSDDNPDRELCRFEFLELLLRIANAKYR